MKRRGVPTGASAIRYLPDQTREGPKKAAPPNPNHWGGRFTGNAPDIGKLVSVMALPSMSAPRPIGLQFWRATESSAPTGGASGIADVRAVVTFSAGESRQLVFRCDWHGGVLLHAQSVSVELESFGADPLVSFVTFPVDVAATLALDAPRPPKAPTLTYQPTIVADAATRAIELPAAAQRVGLLLRYGEPVGSPADAPLGQIFVTFVDRLGTSMGWIDAQNAREALFGDGMPIPAGANRAVLSNRSGWDVALGAVFHLGF
jgi:hypothetical protein